MEIRIRNDSVEITGYVNAVERLSKPLMSRIGRFIERIKAGAFGKALKRNDDVHILLNHDWSRDLGSTKRGNLELVEDSIGLKARATIDDAEVVAKAKAGDLIGWSFGFSDREVIQSMEQEMPLREVKDMDLYEVSLLDRQKSPAYEGTLVMVRSDEEALYIGEAYIDDVEVRDETTAEPPSEEVREEPQQEEELPEAEIDYSEFENMIRKMREDAK